MFALAMAGPAWASPHAVPIRVSAGPLSHTLREIARQTGEELLFDEKVVGQRRCPAINAYTTAFGAVRIALAGTGLIVRRTASGVLIVEAPAARTHDTEQLNFEIPTEIST